MAFILIPVMTVVAYLLGSLSTAIIVSRYFGMEDPRTYGSGNPGASNMLRSGRKDVAALTLLGDALKGLVAVWLALCLQSMFELGDGIVAMAAIAVVVGHMWPFFFGFKGGKGVATALGVMLGMSFWTAFWVVAIWVAIAVKFKKSSLAALIAAACAPFVSFIVQAHHPKLSWALFLIAVLVLCRHKDNVKRLKEGNELGIGEAAQPLKDGQVQTSAPVAQSDEEVLDKAIAEEIAQAEELVEEVEEKAKESVEKAKESAEEVVEKIKDSVEEKVAEVKEKAQEVVEEVKEAVEIVKEEVAAQSNKAEEETEAPKAEEKTEEKAEKPARKPRTRKKANTDK